MRRTRVGSGLAMLVVVALTATACAQGDSEKKSTGQSGAGALKVELHEPEPAPELPSDVVLPEGDGKAKCSGAKLAYIGTIQGENRALGQNILGGIKLAVKQHNDANPGCQVKLEEFDTQGTPDGAPGVVKQAISDPKILGVAGLPFSGETKATGKSFHEAGLVTVSPSATNPDLSSNGWKTFFRALATDADQGPAAAKFISESLKAEKVCVVSDDAEYGIGLASQLKDSLGDKVVCDEKVKTKQVEFSSVVGNIMNEEPDLVYYAGYYTEAAPFFQQLRDSGSEAVFMGPDGVRDMQYVRNAGAASEDTLFSCPCLPSEGFGSFAEDYEALNKAAPSTYSPEGYDVATVLLQGIDNGVTDRAGMLEFVRNYDGQGLTKHFKWDDKGELAETPIWSYRVKDGKIERYEDLTK